MKAYLRPIFALSFLLSCNGRLDQKEFSRHCPDTNGPCSVHYENVYPPVENAPVDPENSSSSGSSTSESPSNGGSSSSGSQGSSSTSSGSTSSSPLSNSSGIDVSWSTTPNPGPPPGSGSDSAMFECFWCKDDVPDDDTGSLGDSSTYVGPGSPGYDPGPTGDGPGGNGEGGPDGEVKGHGTPDPDSPECRKNPSDPNSPPDPEKCPPNKEVKTGGPNEFQKAIGSIERGFKSFAGEFNGQNNKKRKKAREGKRLLRDAEDTLKQVGGLLDGIKQETDAIKRHGSNLSLAGNELQNSASDSTFKGIADRYNAKKDGVLANIPAFGETPDPKKANGGKGLFYENQKLETGRKYVAYARERVEKFKGQADYGARVGLVNAAEGAMEASGEAYGEGKPQEGNTYHEIGLALADIALSFTPIVGVGKDLIEGAWGHSILDGHKLTSTEQTMAIVGVATLGLGKIGAFGKLAKLGKLIGKAARGGEEAAQAAKAVERAETILVAAEKAGVKDKKILDELVEVVKDGMPCRVAFITPMQKFLDFLMPTAYAVDCTPAEVEKKAAELLENAAKEGIPAPTFGRVQTRVNLRNGNPNEVGSGLDYALKKHGGTGPNNKSQFTIARDKLTQILQRKDLVSTPVFKSSDSGNFIRHYDAGEIVGHLPVTKGKDPVSVLTVITDEAGNLVNTFPGTLGRGAGLN